MGGLMLLLLLVGGTFEIYSLYRKRVLKKQELTQIRDGWERFRMQFVRINIELVKMGSLTPPSPPDVERSVITLKLYKEWVVKYGYAQNLYYTQRELAVELEEIDDEIVFWMSMDVKAPMQTSEAIEFNCNKYPLPMMIEIHRKRLLQLRDAASTTPYEFDKDVGLPFKLSYITER